MPVAEDLMEWYSSYSEMNPVTGFRQPSDAKNKYAQIARVSGERLGHGRDSEDATMSR